MRNNLPEGSYGRRNRQAIAARDTRVAARLRAVEQAYRAAIERDAGLKPPEPTQHAALKIMLLIGRLSWNRRSSQSKLILSSPGILLCKQYGRTTATEAFAGKLVAHQHQRFRECFHDRLALNMTSVTLLRGGTASIDTQRGTSTPTHLSSPHLKTSKFAV